MQELDLTTGTHRAKEEVQTESMHVCRNLTLDLTVPIAGSKSISIART